MIPSFNSTQLNPDPPYLDGRRRLEAALDNLLEQRVAEPGLGEGADGAGHIPARGLRVDWRCGGRGRRGCWVFQGC